jgi:hypothetical protein
MRTIENIVNGMKVIEVIMEETDFSSDELIATRLSICNMCEFVSTNKDSCSKCSCLLESRTKYVEMFCPIGKW